jgi:hypothetical protein
MRLNVGGTINLADMAEASEVAEGANIDSAVNMVDVAEEMMWSKEGEIHVIDDNFFAITDKDVCEFSL